MSVADETGLIPSIVEKDYVLGNLLNAMFTSEDIRASWVFKGGTCLKKCFFETYRFSEDLDFTITNPAYLNKDFLHGQLSFVSELLYDSTGIVLPAEKFRFNIYSNKRDQPSCEGRVYYKSYFAAGKESYPKIKLDLTNDEILVLPASLQNIFHNYSDNSSIDSSVMCYKYEELFAEKIRALAERGRPRDLYDVINMFRKDDYLPSDAVIMDILFKKCEFKGIDIPTLETIQAGKTDLESNWEPMLKNQLPELPLINAYWQVLPDFFSWLNGKSPSPKASLKSVTFEGESYRPLYGSLKLITTQGNSMEIIRFAAFSRLCVDLHYNGEVRRIEPYSLRKTQSGNILLYAVKVTTGEIRSYRVDRIEGATLTDEIFNPRYIIELSPNQPLTASGTYGTSNTLGLPSRSKLRKGSKK